MNVRECSKTIAQTEGGGPECPKEVTLKEDGSHSSWFQIGI